MLALLGLLSTNSLLAQVASYTYTQSSGTYTPIVGGSVLGTEVNDDNAFNNLPIGFNFCFNGVVYNIFSINNNGFIAMGPTVATGSYTNISTGTSNNAIHVANVDLQSQNSGGELRYQTIGVAPNRTLVVQYKNYRGYLSVGDNLNFQIRINEGTNTVDLVYGSCTMGATNRSVQVGLRGNSAADFNNRSVINLTNTWATSVAGVANTAACDLQTALVPASGLTFTYTPPTPPAAPTTLTFSGVTTNGMSLNWVDNSTDELNFVVFRSLDGINYTQVGTVASATTGATGTPYNFPQAGLNNGTLYYYQVVAVSGASCSAPLSGSQTTLPGTLCGTISVGPTGTYTSLTAAFAAIVTNGLNCPLILELQPAYVSSVETFPLVVPSLGASATNTVTVRPQAGATNLSITSGATQTLNFTGATWVTFDGRPGGLGTTPQLTIDNTIATGSAVGFVNDASNNALRYLNIRGITSSTTNGVVNFGISTTTAGNSDNTIANCDLSDGASTPNNLIYSNNSLTNAFNARNMIMDNTFSDFFSPALASNAVLLNNAGNTAWTITGNSFYQTATRTATTANNHAYINIFSSAGFGYTVSNNYFGGSAPLCGGTAATYAGTVATRMNIVWVTTGFGATSVVSGNTVRNFNLTTTSGSTTLPGIFSGIFVQGTGNYDVTSNTIGNTLAGGSIVTSTSTTGGLTLGISSNCSGNTNIANNNIGGFTCNSSAVSISSSFSGINASSGRNTITGNLIGSLSQNGNILNTASTGTTAAQMSGILLSSTFTNVVTGNTVSNLSNFYAGTATGSQMRGIASSSGINTISNNTVRRIGSQAPHASTDAAASVIGISLTSTTAGVNSTTVQTVTGNSLSAFGNGSPTGNVNVIGIHFTGPTNGSNVIAGNTITTMGGLTSGVAVLTGINLVGGTNSVYNNMVALGSDDLGGTVTGGYEFNGIKKNATTNMNIYFNSVNIFGTGVSSNTGNTSAFRRSATGVDVVRNNIFANTRSNATTGGTHYAINLNATNTATVDNNNYWGNGNGYSMGIVGVTSYATFNAWKLATSFDANSFHANPVFTTSTNLHINNPGISTLESRAAVIPGITTDIDAQTRPGPTGSVNGGGTIPDIGADEFDGFPITVDVGVSAVAWPSSGCPNDTVKYTLKNYAGVPLNLSTNPVTIVAFTTGTNPVAFPNTVVNTGTIAPNGTMTVTVSSTYSMAAAGTYTFRGYTQLGADLLNSNDTLPATNFVVGGGTGTTQRSTICEFDSTLATVTGYTNGGTIQWQSSPDNLTWTNVPGATSASYMTHPTPPVTYYRAVVCGLHNSTSDTVNVTVTPAPTVVGDTVCGLGTPTLTASGGANFNWYAAPTGGAPLTTGATYSPTVSSTTTYYVSSGNPPGLHTTTYAAGNGSSGNAFTVKALNTITVTGFDGHASNTTAGSWEIWYRPNDYLLTPGSQTSTVGWTQLVATPAIPAFGTGQITPIVSNLSLTIPAGATYSFQIFRPSGSVAYTNGGVLGSLYNANADLEVYQGHGGGPFAGMTIATRVWNGRIHYFAGCESGRTPVTAVVTPAPPVSITASNTISCSNDPVDLIAVHSNPTYNFVWAPGTGLNTTTNDTVVATPSALTTYVVTASDTVSGCVTTDTVTIAAALKPIVTATAAPDTTCGGDTIQLGSTVAPITVQVGTGTIQNTTTTYPAPYGNWYWGARHQMLILASELTASGASAGFLNSLAFDVQGLGTSGALTNYEIKLATTNATAVTAFLNPTFTSVFFSPSYTPVVGITPHVFSAPFYWDGVSNILVETCFNNGAFLQNCVFNQSATAFSSTVFLFQDAVGVCTNATVSASIAQRPNMYFSISKGYGYDWTPSVNLFTPNADSTLGNPFVTSNFVISVTDSATTCVGTDTVNVHVNTLPVINLGLDRKVCGTSETLDAGNPGAAFIWSTTDTVQSIVVTATGSYDVMVTDSFGCMNTDTVGLTFVPQPVINIGADTSFCAGGSAVLDAGLVPATYLWSTNAVTQTITVTTTGSYSVAATDSNGCVANDTVNVTVNALPTVNASAAADSVCNTDNTPVTLTGTPAGGTFSGPGVTGNQFSAPTAGPGNQTITYSFTDGNGCSNTATVSIFVETCVGVENGSSFAVSLHPNPNDGRFIFAVSMENAAEVAFEISDARGVVVMRKKSDQPSGLYEQEIDLADFATGVYTLRVTVDGATAHKRIVVQR